MYVALVAYLCICPTYALLCEEDELLDSGLINILSG